MRITSTTIAAAAMFLACVHLTPASAQDDDAMVITPESYADMINGDPNAPPPPNTNGPAAPPSVAAYPQGNAGDTYQPAQGYASEKLPGAEDNTFSMDEIKSTGHRVFGKVSVGFAKVVERAFSRYGRPNGYILGEEAGGAVVAGLRYGEGVLYTKDAGEHRVFWQGPSVGYDFGAAGSKTMVLVYNMANPSQIYERFPGVDGSAYFIGGVGITYLERNDVVLAPIRSGVGLRLGANIGYLKYTRQPTWNPF